jgi:hypothetical protein
MSEQDTNQNRSRKSGGTSSFTDAGTPSRAPRQDEQGDDRVGSRAAAPPPVDSGKQGISNRPAEDEQPYEGEAGPADDNAAASNESEAQPKQQGGPRGGV